MEKRKLGKTGLKISLLGFGGFHLIEIPADRAADLLTTYLDRGGNYLETAASYGDGESEKKIGEIVKNRRDELVLASKTGVRDAEGAMAEIDRSLKNLQTDHLDIIFMHGVGDEADLEEILKPGGSLEAAKKAKEMGKVKHIGITAHGQPDVLLKALKTDDFDVMMTHFNYFDKFNFPKLAEEFKPLTEADKEELFANAEELGDYICRQCDECSVSKEFGENIKDVFRMEGYFDRQMYDGRPRNPAEYALRDRLRFWFGDRELAENRYQNLELKAADLLTKEAEFKACKYRLDIKNKLEIVDYKLGESDVMN
ncbi:aldo/keto reductase [Halanaerobium sp. ST460_2HS_T2]|uniref:aldo/keto reductase n=1 Tax=Halanaerobium sp. ST460_2HS_T2 TaxID=2183914 RepID=UPI000DF454F6|nr:aldo/keto reductase [Halanaerobium sp. ST460_2HS_T2]RCW52197.1 aldo/keto reductase family protein [Halanaerobium sp. ST460_2HS_T2]